MKKLFKAANRILLDFTWNNDRDVYWKKTQKESICSGRNSVHHNVYSAYAEVLQGI